MYVLLDSRRLQQNSYIFNHSENCRSHTERDIPSRINRYSKKYKIIRSTISFAAENRHSFRIRSHIIVIVDRTIRSLSRRLQSFLTEDATWLGYCRWKKERQTRESSILSTPRVKGTNRKILVTRRRERESNQVIRKYRLRNTF